MTNNPDNTNNPLAGVSVVMVCAIGMLLIGNP